MKKSILIRFLFCLVAAISCIPVKAQNNVQAVMGIRVEVIPGSQVVSSTNGDIILAMAGEETPDRLKVDLGTHTLRAPEGMDVLVSCDNIVQTTSGSDDMEIAMNISNHRTVNGDVTLLLNGTVDTRGVEYGLYIGSQLTRVEYD